MKDAIIGIVLTAALMVVFSAYAPILPTQTAYGVYPTQSGESGVVLPGAGDAFAEMNPEMPKRDKREQAEHSLSEVKGVAVDNEQSEQIQREEQSKNMNEIIVAFWHGVAAVLIGEACALALGLILAAAWLRRK